MTPLLEQLLHGRYYANNYSINSCELLHYEAYIWQSKFNNKLSLLCDQDEASQVRTTPTIKTYLWPRYHTIKITQ